jgi:hypothetical protein
MKIINNICGTKKEKLFCRIFFVIQRLGNKYHTPPYKRSIRVSSGLSQLIKLGKIESVNFVSCSLEPTGN